MNMTMVENILKKTAGEIKSVKPDYILLNDGVGYKAIEKIDKIRGIINNDKIIIVIDHDVPAGDSEGAAIFKKLVNFSKEYGIKFIQAKGSGYQVLLDEYVKEGQVIVSCGEHNSIFGGVGALGLNVEVDTMANLLMSGQYEFKVPETINIELKGELEKGISAIDLWISLFGNDYRDTNFEGKSIEFTGEGLKTLTSHDKIVLCSMATKRGSTTACINENDEISNVPKLSFDLSSVKPVAALPVESEYHKEKYDYKTIEELKNIELDAGFIGGYTGGHIEDLRLAAEALKNKRIALGFRLNISPVSSKVYIQAMEEGLLERFIDFGAQILPPSDRNIILQGAGVIGKGEKMITTGSYNYKGCLGTKDSDIYIVSTESVVAAAISKDFQDYKCGINKE